MLWIPLLCQRGMSFLDLEAVARDVVVVKHLVQQFAMTVANEGVEQVAVTVASSP